MSEDNTEPQINPSIMSELIPFQEHMQNDLEQKVSMTPQEAFEIVRQIAGRCEGRELQAMVYILVQIVKLEMANKQGIQIEFDNTPPKLR